MAQPRNVTPTTSGSRRRAESIVVPCYRGWNVQFVGRSVERFPPRKDRRRTPR